MWGCVPMQNRVKRLAQDESAATAIEYGLIVAAILVAIVTVVNGIGSSLNAKIGTIMITDVVRLLLFPALMAFAASSDLLTMTISNRLSLALAGGFFLLTLMIGMSLPAIGLHLAAAAVVLVITFACFSQGWIGGGDAKLATATVLWFGFDHVLDYLIYASLFGGALTLLIVIFRRLHLPEVLARQKWIARLHESGGGVPYGIALAAAALVVYPSTSWMPA
jgi:prepilin peptidase CpaA